MSSSLGRRARKRSRALSLVALALGSAIIAICAEVVRSFVAEEVAGDTNRAQILAVVAVLFVALLVLVLQISEMRKDLNDVESRLPLSVVYFPADTNEHIVALNDAARSVIEGASAAATILAVNSYLEVYPKLEASKEATASLDRYLAAYEKRSKATHYRRLIQVKDWTTSSQLAERKDHLDTRYFRHYEWMLKTAKEPSGSGIGLFEAPSLIPASFVIVKDSDGEGGGSVIWEVFKHQNARDDREGDRLLSTLGVLIVSDRGGSLISMFEDWFRRIEACGTVPARLTST